MKNLLNIIFIITLNFYISYSQNIDYGSSSDYLYKNESFNLFLTLDSNYNRNIKFIETASKNNYVHNQVETNSKYGINNFAIISMIQNIQINENSSSLTISYFQYLNLFDNLKSLKKISKDYSSFPNVHFQKFEKVLINNSLFIKRLGYYDNNFFIETFIKKEDGHLFFYVLKYDNKNIEFKNYIYYKLNIKQV
jgi:hypothetical protein